MHAEVGDLINWYNILFFDQGEYTDCAGLIHKSSSAFPKTSVLEIVAGGVPAEKVVLGKPATRADATNGFIEPTTLAICVADAAHNKWNGGVMVEQVSGTSLSPIMSGIAHSISCQVSSR